MKKAWIILFFIDRNVITEDSNDTPYELAIDKLLDQIRCADGLHTDEVNVILLENKIFIDPRSPINSELLIKRKEKDQLEIIKKYHNRNFGKAEDLSVIVKEITKEYPSDRQIWVTWSHGFGFGIFDSTIAEKISKKTEALTPQSQNTYENLLFKEYKSPQWISADRFEKIKNNTEHKNLARDERPGIDMLTNRELKQVITECYPQKKVDLFIMMNCNMQMVETAYELKDCVQYVVGAETLLWVTGFNFESLISTLYNDPSSDLKAISKKVVLDFETWLQEVVTRFDIRITGSLNKVSVMTISCINLANISLIADEFDKLANICLSENKQMSSTVIEAIQKARDCSKLKSLSDGLPLKDVYTFFSFLTKYLPGNASINKTFLAIKQLYATNGDLIIARYSKSFSINEEDFFATGISIFFPDKNSIEDPTYNTLYSTFYRPFARFRCAFAKCTEWGKHLHRISITGENECV